jgi:hypothetical protein
MPSSDPLPTTCKLRREHRPIVLVVQAEPCENASSISRAEPFDSRPHGLGIPSGLLGMSILRRPRHVAKNTKIESAVTATPVPFRAVSFASACAFRVRMTCNT